MLLLLLLLNYGRRLAPFSVDILYATNFDCLAIHINLKDMFSPLNLDFDLDITVIYFSFMSQTMIEMLINLYLMQGYDIIYQTKSIRSIASASHVSPCYFNVSSTCGHLVGVPSLSTRHRINCHLLCRIHNGFKGRPLPPNPVTGGETSHRLNCKNFKKVRFRIHASIDVATAVDVINDLGLDTLTFLAVTVLVVPAFKRIKASPVSWLYAVGLLKLHWLTSTNLFRSECSRGKLFHFI